MNKRFTVNFFFGEQPFYNDFVRTNLLKSLFEVENHEKMF